MTKTPWTQQTNMPVNYTARYMGQFVKFLDRLDNIEETNPMVERPITYLLRTQAEWDPYLIELLLYRLLIGGYRDGLLP